MQRLILNTARIFPTLLTFAHLASAMALLTFGGRTGGYPVHIIGLAIYLAAVGLSLVVLGIQFFRHHLTTSNFANLVWVSMPAWVSLVLLAMLWLTPWLGGAPYALYDSADPDGVAAFSLLFGSTFVAVSVLYGSSKYGLSACALQLLTYFGAYALPHWLRYPDASPSGIRPVILGEILGPTPWLSLYCS